MTIDATFQVMYAVVVAMDEALASAGYGADLTNPRGERMLSLLERQAVALDDLRQLQIQPHPLILALCARVDAVVLHRVLDQLGLPRTNAEGHLLTTFGRLTRWGNLSAEDVDAK